MKNRRLRKWLYNTGLAVCGIVFLSSAGMLARDTLEHYKDGKAYEEINEIFPDETIPVPKKEDVSAVPDNSKENIHVTIKESISPQEWKKYWDNIAKGRFAGYQKLKNQNADFVGWIHIEGTGIDYPVCYTPNDPEFYLHRDMKKNRSSYGTPFIEGLCSLEDPRTNLLIYGHHMKNGAMFAPLQKYTDLDFYLEHPYVQFDTLTQAGSYEIAAVVKLDAYGNQIPWQKLVFPKNQEEFESAWSTVEKRKFYDTGVEMTAEDELLALVTCEYTQKDGRLMVVARKIS